jgi:hypothetical protein
VDRGLISENPRGLSAKLAKSGLRVDFTKVQGPLCKISKIIRITNYFPTVNPVHRVHARWTGVGRAVHRGPTVARTEGTVARSPELGLRPLWCAKARRRGRKMERGATVVQNREAVALGERAAQAWREGNRSSERCGETR